MSDPATIGALATNVNNSMQGVMDLLSAMSYLAGVVFGIKAALAFKDHNENPERTRLSQPVTFMMMAMMMLTLPTFLETASGGLISTPVTVQSNRAMQQASLDAAALEAKAASDLAKAKALREKSGAASVAAASIAVPSAGASSDPGKLSAAAPAVTFSNPDLSTAAQPKLIKEPKHGGSGDIQALLEVLGLFGILALAGWGLVRRVVRSGRAQSERFHAAIADIDLAIAPSEKAPEKTTR